MSPMHPTFFDQRIYNVPRLDDAPIPVQGLSNIHSDPRVLEYLSRFTNNAPSLPAKTTSSYLPNTLGTTPTVPQPIPRVGKIPPPPQNPMPGNYQNVSLDDANEGNYEMELAAQHQQPIPDPYMQAMINQLLELRGLPPQQMYSNNPQMNPGHLYSNTPNVPVHTVQSNHQISYADPMHHSAQHDIRQQLQLGFPHPTPQNQLIPHQVLESMGSIELLQLILNGLINPFEYYQRQY